MYLSPALLVTDDLIGHYYFTMLLLPILISTAAATGRKTRVINTSSMGHAFVDHIEYDAVKDGPKRRKLGTHKLYFQSKFVRDR